MIIFLSQTLPLEVVRLADYLTTDTNEASSTMGRKKNNLLSNRHALRVV
jgi:predicted DNA-binding protein (UPF0251 family)